MKARFASTRLRLPPVSGLLALAILAGLPGTAFPQNFPVKPVRFVIGPAPDLLPRLIGQKLAERWGQQVVVDQRPGASGLISGEIVARSPADGYTWMVAAGFDLAATSIEEFDAYVKRDVARYAKVVKDARIRIAE